MFSFKIKENKKVLNTITYNDFRDDYLEGYKDDITNVIKPSKELNEKMSIFINTKK